MNLAVFASWAVVQGYVTSHYGTHKQKYKNKKEIMKLL